MFFKSATINLPRHFRQNKILPRQCLKYLCYSSPPCFHFMELNYFIFAVAFRMYDLDGDDRISKEELLAVLTMMVGDNITEEQLNSIAERTIMEADDDKDGFISFDDFCKVLERTDVEQKMSIRFLS